MKHTRFTYSVWWKLPIRIVSLGNIAIVTSVVVFVPIIFPLLEMMGFDEKYIGTVTVNYNNIIPLLIVWGIMVLGSIGILSLFPEFEVEEKRFRLITIFGKTRWCTRNEIYRLSRRNHLGQWNMYSFEIPNLPVNYQFAELIYHFKYPGAFIHPSIGGYDELITYLQGDLSETNLPHTPETHL